MQAERKEGRKATGQTIIKTHTEARRHAIGRYIERERQDGRMQPLKPALADIKADIRTNSRVTDVHVNT